MSGQRGRCCRCDGRKTRAVTIKGMNQSDGVTQWEYGPGSLWRQQPGGNRITGIQWDASATRNKFVLICGVPNLWNNPEGVRVSGAFSANAMQPLELVTISADDGTVIETADLDLFCWTVNDYQFNLGTQYSSDYFIREVLTLSGSDYLIAGHRSPALEWVDYTTDTANKEYVLHAHIQQAGNVYLKTKTSSETITLPYNATASQVATAFNATADCTACTATGGPWPHRKIEVNVTWSVATGDISQMKRDGTYTATGSTGTCTWDWQVTPPFGGSWILNTDLCTGGSTATPPSGSGNPGDVGIPGTCSGGSGGGSVTRKTDGSVATYSTSTGLIETSAGYIFGRDTTTPLKLVTETGSVPSHPTTANQPIPWGSGFGYLIPRTLAAGSGNRVGMQHSNSNPSARAIECWIPGSPWVRQWLKFNNAATETGIHAVGSYFGIWVPRKTFAGGGTVAAVRIEQSTGTVTEYDIGEISTVTANAANWHLSYLLTDNQSKWASFLYERWSQPAVNGQFGSTFSFDFQGSEVYVDSTATKLGLSPGYPIFGTTTSSTFACVAGGAYSNVNILKYITPNQVAGGDAWSHNWLFFAPAGGHNGPPTQWRMRMQGGTTAWLDWDATDAEIKTAFLAVYPENTSGTSNISVNPFGATSSAVNTIGVFEKGLQILFRTARTTSGVLAGFPPNPHFDRLGDVTIEFQNVTGTNSTGVSSMDITNGTQNWARNFGVSLLTGADIIFPKAGWLYDDKVIAYGDVSENELP